MLVSDLFCNFVSILFIYVAKIKTNAIKLKNVSSLNTTWGIFLYRKKPNCKQKVSGFCYEGISHTAYMGNIIFLACFALIGDTVYMKTMLPMLPMLKSTN